MAQAGGGLPLSVQLETGYERAALNYNLLVADTSSLSPDSLEQLQQSADTRTEPLVGLRLAFDNDRFHLDNGVYYAKSGWREQFDGRAVFPLSPSWTIRANNHFEYHQADDAHDTLLVDYWTLAGDIRLLAHVSNSHTILFRADWQRLQYPGPAPSFGYDFDRVRSRLGWSWQSDNFDFAGITAGVGERLAPDSTDREYDERFIEGYLDAMVTDHHRLLFNAAINTRDYRSPDPGDDYTLVSADGRWELGTYTARRIGIGLQWDFWHFGAQDEVSFDFYELRPVLEFKLAVNDIWGLRFGPAYRLAASIDAEYTQADYHQPSGILGLEYMPGFPVWIDARFELGRRNYVESSLGYSDYTIMQFDISADIDFNDRLTLSAGIDYEKEFHTEKTDDTDFLFFTLNLRYCLMR